MRCIYWFPGLGGLIEGRIYNLVSLHPNLTSMDRLGWMYQTIPGWTTTCDWDTWTRDSWASLLLMLTTSPPNDLLWEMLVHQEGGKQKQVFRKIEKLMIWRILAPSDLQCLSCVSHFIIAVLYFLDVLYQQTPQVTWHSPYILACIDPLLG